MMFAHAAERRLQLRAPVFHALARPGIDQIEGIALEDVRGDVSAASASARVQAAERLQSGVVERLHADRDAVDARGAIVAKTRRLDARRIGLERDLGVRRDGQCRR